MCKEIQTRYRKCKHTSLHDWLYCAVLPPSSRNSTVGRACPRYKLRFEKPSAGISCPECRMQARIQEYIEEEKARLARKAERKAARRAAKQNNSPMVSVFDAASWECDIPMGTSTEAATVAAAAISTTNRCACQAGCLGGGGDAAALAQEKLDRSSSGNSHENSEVHKEDGQGKKKEQQTPKGLKAWIREFLLAEEGNGLPGMGFQKMDA